MILIQTDHSESRGYEVLQDIRVFLDKLGLGEGKDD